MPATRTCCVALCLAWAGVARAEPDVRVVVTGTVESNAFSSGTYAGIPPGAPVTMTIDLDSHDYLDSPSLPGVTRGYRFGAGTFSLSVGAVTRSLRTVPALPAYFVLRNNDPRVDGFFLSQGTDIDTQCPLNMTPNNYGIAFSRTFGSVPPVGNDPTLPSVNIMDALGSWGLDNISSYNFTIELNEVVTPMIFAYQTITLSPLGPVCDSIDFNQDTLLPDAADIADFLSVFAGAACPTASCGDIDFNNDGLLPDTQDISAFLSVFSGGPCV
ncbi:MAG: hypothetical protein U0637_13385 [Phycisphaerales bacterium]